MPLAVCATPIGNLDDVTLRVLSELAAADLVLCEDTRRTRVLLERHGLSARLLSYHEHNEAARTAQILPKLAAGERVALLSDAGLPAVSDPGARIVAAALDAGVEVTVLPGASAVETALVASGYAFERYQFVGFFSRGARALEKLCEELAAWPHAVVGFESPQRLPRLLAALDSAMPERRMAVCRELTKAFEEIVRGRPGDLSARFAEPPKGEVTVVLAPTIASVSTAEPAAASAVDELVAAGVPRRQAADVVSRLTGTSRRRLYADTLRRMQR